MKCSLPRPRTTVSNDSAPLCRLMSTSDTDGSHLDPLSDPLPHRFDVADEGDSVASLMKACSLVSFTWSLRKGARSPRGRSISAVRHCFQHGRRKSPVLYSRLHRGKDACSRHHPRVSQDLVGKHQSFFSDVTSSLTPRDEQEVSGGSSPTTHSGHFPASIWLPVHWVL